MHSKDERKKRGIHRKESLFHQQKGPDSLLSCPHHIKAMSDVEFYITFSSVLLLDSAPEHPSTRCTRSQQLVIFCQPVTCTETAAPTSCEEADPRVRQTTARCRFEDALQQQDTAAIHRVRVSVVNGDPGEMIRGWDFLAPDGNGVRSIMHFLFRVASLLPPDKRSASPERRFN
jgi:hypothetical protein